jgi:cob(I)alamin adenosyltransferase
MTASLSANGTRNSPVGRPGNGHGVGSQAGVSRQHLAVVPGGVPAEGGCESDRRPLRLVAQPEGLLQIHTAPFRGSVSAVLSQALRTAGLGSRVLISQFLKGGVEQGLAHSPWLCGRLQWLRPAVFACLSEPAASHDADTCAAVQEVWAFSREQLLAGAVDLMVLDELALAVELNFIPLAEVIQVLEARPAHLDVILTGPAMAPELMALADQVTQLRRGL